MRVLFALYLYSFYMKTLESFTRSYFVHNLINKQQSIKSNNFFQLYSSPLTTITATIDSGAIASFKQSIHNVTKLSTINKIATSAIINYSKIGKIKECRDIFTYIQILNIADSYTYSAVMNAYTRNNRFSEAVSVFNTMKANNISIDSVTYCTAVRAISSCQPYNHTNIILLLDESFNTIHIANNITHIIHSALTNLNYLQKGHNSDSKSATTHNKTAILQYSDDILDWMSKRGIQPTEKTMVRGHNYMRCTIHLCIHSVIASHINNLYTRYI